MFAGRRLPRPSSPMSTDSNMSPAITQRRPRRHKQNQAGQQDYEPKDIFNDGKDWVIRDIEGIFAPYLLIALTFGFPQTPACLWVSPARCPMVTTRWGGPRCLGWALGRLGAAVAALGLTGSKRWLPMRRERDRISTRLQSEEREAAKADSTQVMDELNNIMWHFSKSKGVINPL